MCYVCLTVGLRVLTSAMHATTGMEMDTSGFRARRLQLRVLSRTQSYRHTTAVHPAFSRARRRRASAPLICCLCSTGALLAYFCIFNLGPLPCILCAAMLLVGSCMDVLLLTCCSLYLCSLSVLSALLPGSTCASSSLRHGVVVRRETLCVRWLSALLPLIPVCVLHSVHISSQLGFF
jgi:hypothetical protein